MEVDIDNVNGSKGKRRAGGLRTNRAAKVGRNPFPTVGCSWKVRPNLAHERGDAAKGKAVFGPLLPFHAPQVMSALAFLARVKMDYSVALLALLLALGD